MTNLRPVVGGDPGVHGAVAVIGPLGRVLFVQGFQPDMTLTEVRDACRAAARIAGPGAHAWVESVNSRPGEGHVGAHTFGRAKGWLEMGLRAHDLEVHHVGAMMWQARLECLTGGNKNVSKRRAVDLFGAQVPKITHVIADALLIAEYGRLQGLP